MDKLLGRLISKISGKKNNTVNAQVKNVEINYFEKYISNSSVQLLDIRTPQEYADGHITNAINICSQEEDFVERVLKRLDTEYPLAVYCQSGKCSFIAAKRLAEVGFQVTNLNCGFSDWVLKGKRVSKAMPSFRPFNIHSDFHISPFEWMRNGVLVCAGDHEKSNAMTVGWSTMGNVWGKDTVYIYVAKTRYTHEFLDKAKYFTIMVMKDPKIIEFMGTRSGRDMDKAQALGLHTCYTDHGTPYYEEASIVIEARIMCVAPVTPSAFRDEVPRQLYNQFPDGYHSVFISAIENAWIK